MARLELDQVVVFLMVRDLTLVAKQHYDLARSFTAMAGTWRQVLAPAQLLSDPGHLPGSDGKVAAPPTDPLGKNLEMDYD